MTPLPRFPRAAHSGTGPGEITPDGCAVEMWTQLPAGAEPGIIAAAVPRAEGATLLELGAGAGRLTRPLLVRGFRVTAVDESAAMLARIAAGGDGPEGAGTVCSAIEDLDLGERFDVVTLTSCLVNTADPEQRDRLLRTCAAHVADGGQVIIQREPVPERGRPRTGDTWTRGGMTIRVVSDEPADQPADQSADQPADQPAGETIGEPADRTAEDQDGERKGVRRICVAYASGTGERWTQTFYSRPLTTPVLRDALAAAGLALDALLSADGSWLRAVPLT